MNTVRACGSFAMAATCRLLVITVFVFGGWDNAWAQLVPGTGQRVEGASDDFEDPKWEFIHNFPKSSRNLDTQERLPLGNSRNELWYESAKRGQPDVIARVTTPKGGLPDSKGALLLRSLHTGVPRIPSTDSQQDDLLVDVSLAIDGYIPTSWLPSVVVRVYLPPFKEWENATDTSFGFRTQVVGSAWTKRHRKRFSLARKRTKMETYWPGMFIQFNSKDQPEHDADSAVFIIRADELGRDVLGPVITQTGWWTLGMSFTSDGRVHYYASPGIDDLTSKDHIMSFLPYDSPAEQFDSYFFNVCNQNDGKQWSTNWVIDDPSVYWTPRE